MAFLHLAHVITGAVLLSMVSSSSCGAVRIVTLQMVAQSAIGWVVDLLVMGVRRYRVLHYYDAITAQFSCSCLHVLDALYWLWTVATLAWACWLQANLTAECRALYTGQWFPQWILFQCSFALTAVKVLAAAAVAFVGAGIVSRNNMLWSVSSPVLPNLPNENVSTTICASVAETFEDARDEQGPRSETPGTAYRSQVQAFEHARIQAGNQMYPASV